MQHLFSVVIQVLHALTTSDGIYVSNLALVVIAFLALVWIMSKNDLESIIKELVVLAAIMLLGSQLIR